MARQCPVGESLVDAHAARIIAATVVTMLIAYFVSSQVMFVAVLVVDYLLRAFGKPRYAPVAMSSRALLRLFGVRPHMVNAAPKVFAAKLGLLFSSTMLVTHLLGYPLVAMLVGAMLLFCAFLEGVVGFCLGCAIYSMIPWPDRR